MHANINMSISALYVREPPEFPRRIGNRKLGSKNTIVTSYFRPEVEIRQFRACALKYAIPITLIYGRIAEIPPSYRKSGSLNDSVGHNGLSYRADTTFHTMYS